MNYYKRHLGDYAKDTKTLSVFEHGVYTLLLDYYYSEEAPVSDEDAYALCRISGAKEKASLDKVLHKYFKKVDDLWHHSYADRVIQAAADKAELNRANGPKGGRPSNASKVPRGTEPSNNHEGDKEITIMVNSDNPKITLATTPLAISQEKTKTTRGASALAGFDGFWLRYPKKIGKGAAEKAWAKIRPDDALRQTILAAVGSQATSQAWIKDRGQFIPNPATWLNQRRWEDQIQGDSTVENSAWWHSAEGITAKGGEFGIYPHEERFEDVWPRFKIEVMREANRRGIQCSDKAA